MVTGLKKIALVLWLEELWKLVMFCFLWWICSDDLKGIGLIRPVSGVAGLRALNFSRNQQQMCQKRSAATNSRLK
jgi:hypothetical protein